MIRPLLLTILLAGCGSSTSATPVGPTDAGVDADVCGPVPGPYREGRDPPAYCVKTVSGSVVSEGAPLAARAMTVCGPACFYGKTDAAGAFRIRVNAMLPDGQYTFFAHGRPSHASLYVPLPLAPAEMIDLPPIELPLLPTGGTALPPDTNAAPVTVTSGAVELGVQADTTWELAFEDAADDVAGRLLRAVKLPVERAPSFAAGAAVVYALAPFEAKPSKPVSLRLADTGGLAAGTAVDILVMDGFVFGAPTNASGLPKIAAKGHVSADGTSVTTDEGEGLSLLTWIAIRAQPVP